MQSDQGLAENETLNSPGKERIFQNSGGGL